MQQNDDSDAEQFLKLFVLLQATTGKFLPGTKITLVIVYIEVL